MQWAIDACSMLVSPNVSESAMGVARPRQQAQKRIDIDMRCCLNLLRECYYPFWAEAVKFTYPKSPQQNASPSVFDTSH